jgi:hypothetical protein
MGLACQRPIEPPPSPPPPSSPPPPPNHVPVAVAGGPYTSSDGTVLFDGSASSDSDGDALTFAWNFGDGTNSAEMKPRHTYAQDGDYDVTLMVTDTKAAKSPEAKTQASVSRSVIFVGAGNIASGSRMSEATAKLLDAILGTVFTTGDNAFPDGTDSVYTKYYAPGWGRHLARTRPVLGNHDYQSGNANGSFNYFGDKVGPRGLGYYSYNLGAWHVIVLNDKGSDGPFIDASSPQGQWLTADLEANKDTRCTIALWHVPLFVSSNVANWTYNPNHKPVWDILYAAGVDVVLNGQQHNYERFAPMNPNGDLDPVRGIREFNVGTGGAAADDFTKSINPHSEARTATFGVLKLTLKGDGYDWQFVPVAGATFNDSGSGSCH